MATSRTPGCAPLPRVSEHGSGLVARADCAEPARAEARISARWASVSGFCHERRRASDPAFVRARRRERRLRRPAVEEADDRGLLAGDEALRHVDDAHRDSVGGVPSTTLRDRVGDRGVRGTSNGDDRLAGAERRCGEHRSIEHEVREVGEQDLVLADSAARPRRR